MSAYLAHHGIRGQKWGHRNGPPYPLKPQMHSAAENKAGWRRSLDSNGGSSSSSGSSSSGSGSKKEPIHFKKKTESSESTKPKKQKKELTDEEKAERRKKRLKRVAIGLGTAAGVAGAAYLATKGMKHLNKHPELLEQLSDKVSNSKIAKEIADADHTAKEFKSNVKNNVAKAKWNLESEARERARKADNDFSELLKKRNELHERETEQKNAYDNLMYIATHKDSKDALKQDKVHQLMKQYNVSGSYTDKDIRDRADMHYKSYKNLSQRVNELDRADTSAEILKRYRDATGENVKSKRKRAKMQRIMQEARTGSQIRR